MSEHKYATAENILKYSGDLETWPFQVWGTLQERVDRTVPEPTKRPSYLSWEKDQDKMMEIYVNTIRENRGLAISCLFSTLIAVSASLAVNLLFSPVDLSGFSSRVPLFLFFLIAAAFLFVFFIMNIPINRECWLSFYIDKLLLFPDPPNSNLQKYLTVEPKKINEYAMVIALAMVRDFIPQTSEQRLLAISNISEMKGAVVIGFNLKPDSRSLILDPRIPDKIENELRQFVYQLRGARMQIEVMDFEISPKAWKGKGKEFENRIRNMNFDALRATLLDQMKNRWNSPDRGIYA